MTLRGLISGGMGGECKMPSMEIRTAITFEGRLREEKQNLEKRLADVNAVLKALKEAPQVAEVIEALNKLGY